MQYTTTMGVLKGIGHLGADSRDLPKVPQIAQFTE